MSPGPRTLVAPADGADAVPSSGSGLGGTHVIRTFLLAPFIVLLLTPFAMRNVYLHPAFYSSPVRVSTTDAGSRIENLVLLVCVTFQIMSQVLEASRRCKLPMRTQANLGPRRQVSERGLLDASKPRTVVKLRGCLSWRLNARNMHVWDTFDLVEATIMGACLVVWIVVSASYEDVDGQVVNWATVILLAVCGIIAPFLEILIIKRILFAIATVQGERMPAFLTGLAMPVAALAVCVQVFVMLVYANASTTYPYWYPAHPANAARNFAEMLTAANSSGIQCDDEVVFWASFRLPFTYEEHTFDCDDPLCGYRAWTDLCQAWRVSFLARSTDEVVEEVVLAIPLLLAIPIVLIGSDRISRSSDGGIDLERLMAPHILLILGLHAVYFVITLNLLAMFLLQAPLLMQGQAPADPLSACGPDSFCYYCADREVGMYFGLAAIVLLPIDTLKRVLDRYNNRRRSYFLSYKQNDGNDGAVQMLANGLRSGGAKNVWLDKLAEDRSEQGMVKGVRESDVFVAVVSPAYFASWFCCLEIHTALKEGKPILVVWNQSKHTVQVALKWLPDELGVLKNNELLPIQEDIQMATTCTSRIIGANPKVLASRLDPEEVPAIETFQTRATGQVLVAQDGSSGDELLKLEQRLKTLEGLLERPLALGMLEDHQIA